MTSISLLSVLVLGIGFRVWLTDTAISNWLGDRNEVVTPLTSWKRVTEGLALHRAGISPYAGDLFHEMPLMLRILNYCSNMLRSHLYLIFVITDFVTAILLERIAKYHARYLLDKQMANVSKYSTNAISLLLKGDSLAFTRFYVIVIYLLNPYGIASCVVKSTAVFNNFNIAAAILSTIAGRRGWACWFIAWGTYISMYPVMLLIPAAVYFANNEVKRAPAAQKRSCEVWSYVRTGAWFTAWMAVLLYVSFLFEGSWKFLGSTYGFILTVPDFSPNLGVFWYFFAEMFEHFRLFFTCVFQINAFIYTVPLAFRLKEHPIFFMYILVAIMSVFKSYPSYADASLYISMLPLWSFIFPYMRNSFVVTVMFCVSSVLAPILYHLWIYAGSANANFYFAITLVYCTAQIFLITDLLYGFLRREYDLYNGTKPKEINGKPCSVLLE